jgi:hypothetical protein
MVAPLVAGAAVAGGAQILSSIAQYYQSEKNAKATSEKLEEIKALFNGIKPPDYDFSVQDPPNLIKDGIPEAALVSMYRKVRSTLRRRTRSLCSFQQVVRLVVKRK